MMELLASTSDFGNTWAFNTGRYALEHLRSHYLVKKEDQLKLTDATWTLLDDCLMVEDIRAVITAYEPWRTLSAPSGETEQRPLDPESLPIEMRTVELLVNAFCVEKWKPWLANGVNFEDFASPDNPLYYPDWKKPSKENTKRMQEAEKHLGTLWGGLQIYMGVLPYTDENGEQTSGCAVDLLFGDAWVQEEPTRTSDWVEPEPKTKSDSIKHASGNLAKPGAQDDPDAWYNKPTQNNQQSSRWKPETSKKEKEKTSKEASQAASSIQDIVEGFTALPMPQHFVDEAVQPSGVSQANPDGVVFPLSRKAMEGAQQLWPQLFRKRSDGTTNDTGDSNPYSSQAGSMDWRLFQKIWTGIGFSIIPITGSSWDFRPSTEDAKKIFREPFQEHKFYPDARTPLQIVLKIGRYLKRKYDIEAEWFVEKKGEH